VYYKISGDNKRVFILFVLDGRRNLEEILVSKVIKIIKYCVFFAD
jgi:hypothetical protein